MSTIPATTAGQAAEQAGFKGNSLVTILAIAMAESGFDISAQNKNSDGSIDRGILQINSRWHPEVTDACAYDAVCSFKAAYTISQQGQNFGPWTTYTTGKYKQDVPYVQGQIQFIPDPNNIIANPGGAISGVAQNIVSQAFQPFFAALPGFGIKVALFMSALMLVIIGLWALTRNPVSDTGSAVTTGLNNAARKIGGKE